MPVDGNSASMTPYPVIPTFMPEIANTFVAAQVTEWNGGRRTRQEVKRSQDDRGRRESLEDGTLSATIGWAKLRRRPVGHLNYVTAKSLAVSHTKSDNIMLLKHCPRLTTITRLEPLAFEIPQERNSSSQGLRSSYQLRLPTKTNYVVRSTGLQVMVKANVTCDKLQFFKQICYYSRQRQRVYEPDKERLCGHYTCFIIGSMRVIEVNMEQRRNERAGETGDPPENPPTSGIVRHDSHIVQSKWEDNVQKTSTRRASPESPLPLPERVGLFSSVVTAAESGCGESCSAPPTVHFNQKDPHLQQLRIAVRRTIRNMTLPTEEDGWKLRGGEIIRHVRKISEGLRWAAANELWVRVPESHAAGSASVTRTHTKKNQVTRPSEGERQGRPPREAPRNVTSREPRRHNYTSNVFENSPVHLPMYTRRSKVVSIELKIRRIWSICTKKLNQ
ncbi:hypothetical protein PR048_028698 [Dryococelus australis]|uniref:Uncharacterized protein n=1 Tax=Dryococelus australis TaxID=614101 RepID=A0ABQ9GBS2_9NEOP|nr:hypothetical protein PR048_028698 [Dryococelus australis]